MSSSQPDTPPEPELPLSPPPQTSSSSSSKSQILSFLKTLASFTGDLSQLTCPAFLLSGTSVLEYTASWADHPDLLAAIPREPTPERRMLAVVRWLVSTFYGSFYARSKTATEKKPFNPVLGEYFQCCWEPASATATANDGDAPSSSSSSSSSSASSASGSGSTASDAASTAATASSPQAPPLSSSTVLQGDSALPLLLLLPVPTDFPKTRLFAEQVSHHPPVSAFYADNDIGTVFLNGSLGQRTRFKTTYIKVEQSGCVLLHVKLPDGSFEDYFIALPELALRGLVSAQMFLEIVGSSSIRSSSGCATVINYIPKPWIGGEYHGISGSVFRKPPTLPSSLNSSASTPLSGSVNCDYAKKTIPPPTSASSSSSPSSPANPYKGLEVYKFAGNWTRSLSVTDVATGAVHPLYDAELQPTHAPQVRPLEEQDNYESRRLWNSVSVALASKNYSEATRHKTQIEEAQRAFRRERQEKKIEWAPSHFIACNWKTQPLVSEKTEVSINLSDCISGMSEYCQSARTNLNSSASSTASALQSLSNLLKTAELENETIADVVTWLHRDLLKKER